MNNYKQYYLKVDNIHKLSIEVHGNINGKPIIYLHGGPGDKIWNDTNKFFNLSKYKLILFDQRGCGKSTPFGSLKNNESKYIVDDVEKIRKFLKINKWTLFGGSWGATLSILYATKYPQYISKIIIRGFSLFTNFFQIIKYQFPILWDNFCLGMDDEKKIIHKYLTVFKGKDSTLKKKYVDNWFYLEEFTSKLKHNFKKNNKKYNYKYKENIAKLEAHYYYNNAFFNPKKLIKDLKKLNNIPVIIIHGRYDVICPPSDSYLLSKNIKNSKLIIVENAPHSAYDENIRKEFKKHL